MNDYSQYGIYMTYRHVFFFKNTCPFSNFYLASFCEDINDPLNKQVRINTHFFCTEQYFMYIKACTFNDYETAKDILNEKTSPKVCKYLGRKVKNYNDKVWNDIRYNVMLEGNILKFTQNKELKDFILNDDFKNKTFVEASPFDNIWGIGMKIDDVNIDIERKWRGQNLQGKVITQVRDTLLKG